MLQEGGMGDGGGRRMGGGGEGRFLKGPRRDADGSTTNLCRYVAVCTWVTTARPRARPWPGLPRPPPPSCALPRPPPSARRPRPSCDRSLYSFGSCAFLLPPPSSLHALSTLSSIPFILPLPPSPFLLPPSSFFLALLIPLSLFILSLLSCPALPPPSLPPSAHRPDARGHATRPCSQDPPNYISIGPPPPPPLLPIRRPLACLSDAGPRERSQRGFSF